MIRMRGVVFWMLALAVAACHLVVIAHSLSARFWEDEAFNLTVPLNLLAGLGYSSDGALSGSMITPFDARISTGPTVLLPVAGVLLLGGDPVLGARLVPMAFWVLLIGGLVLLGRRVAGRWAALLAALAPLAFNTTEGISPIQGPADLLGEIPAAALLVWALIAVQRRPWVAGVLVGLAVQAKLIALLALPAFAVTIWARASGRGWSRLGQTLRDGWLPLLLAGVPTLLFELWALWALGGEGFVEHLRQMVRFVRSGGQNHAPTTVAQKLDTLASAWFVPAWVAWATAAVITALVLAGVLLARRRGALSPRLLGLALAGGVGTVTFVAWWSTAAHTPLWVRHPAVGVFAFVPVLVIVACAGLRELWLVGAGSSQADTGDARRLPSRVAAVALGAALVASVVCGVAAHVQLTGVARGETLSSQRAEAEKIAEWVDRSGAEWLAANPWGAAVAPVVMSGAPVGLCDAPAMARTAQLTGSQCTTETLLDAGRYRVCAAPK